MIRVALTLVLIFPAAAEGTVVLYDGTSFPEELGWERVGTMDAQRWIDDGWFVHRLTLGEHPPVGEQDGYQRLLQRYQGADHFVAEARISTNGPPEEIVGVAPASFLLTSSSAGTRYQLTISNGLVRFIRYGAPGVLFFDVTADLPHSYRFDLFGDEWYEFRIDDILVDSGFPTADLLTEDAMIYFSGSYYLQENVNRWDYVSFGQIPEPASAALFLAGSAWLRGRRQTKSCSRR